MECLSSKHVFCLLFALRQNRMRLHLDKSHSIVIRCCCWVSIQPSRSRCAVTSPTEHAGGPKPSFPMAISHRVQHQTRESAALSAFQTVNFIIKRLFSHTIYNKLEPHGNQAFANPCQLFGGIAKHHILSMRDVADLASLPH